jgi:hypothetical protein
MCVACRSACGCHMINHKRMKLSTAQELVRSGFADRTILTIAHRLNTIIDNDKILLMDFGRVAECASHTRSCICNPFADSFVSVPLTSKTWRLGSWRRVDMIRRAHYSTTTTQGSRYSCANLAKRTRASFARLLAPSRLIDFCLT